MGDMFLISALRFGETDRLALWCGCSSASICSPSTIQIVLINNGVVFSVLMFNIHAVFLKRYLTGYMDYFDHATI